MREASAPVLLGGCLYPSALAPRAHIWVADKLRWVHIDDGLPAYDATREGDAPTVP